MRLAGNVVHVKDKKNPHRETWRNEPPGRPRHRCESNAMLLKYHGRFIWLNAWTTEFSTTPTERPTSHKLPPPSHPLHPLQPITSSCNTSSILCKAPTYIHYCLSTLTRNNTPDLKQLLNLAPIVKLYHKNSEYRPLTIKTAKPTSISSICKYRLPTSMTSSNIIHIITTYNTLFLHRY